ncbi:MAG: hypothetical protein QM698_06745 [Micropepsaceae bacterium]
MSLPKAAPDGLAASVMLAFLATAGLFYVNIMAALVAGLVDGLGFQQADAGLVGSVNVYGAALGGLIAVFIVRRAPWRLTATALLLSLIAIDLASIYVRTAEPLIALRAIHGVLGGMLVGIAFGVIARTAVPDRTFGMLLVVQFGLGGLGVMFLPGLVPVYGTAVLFIALAAFSLVTLAMTLFLADYPVMARMRGTVAAGEGIRWRPLAATLVALFLFQAGNMALAAYLFGLGRAHGLTTDFISDTVGIATWIGIAGAVLVILFGLRMGRFWPLLVSMALTIAGNYAFHWTGDTNIFIAANVLTAITWAFVIPYLLGMCASFDKAGQTAALGGFFSKMGLATGPLVGGRLLGEANYPLLIDAAAIVLIVCALAALPPAWWLDRRAAAR